MDGDTLYLVYLDAGAALDDLDERNLAQLAPGLYLVASTRTRSELYHAVKWLRHPSRLLVAPLADGPKFKGMMPGALGWLRWRQGEARRGSRPALR
ncbi:hypothetical protein [Pseudoxanthomonas sp. 10H]|uniref:hypothetical protein n=1 Tax=Pseudoxanthomonas sp. 10H TaxID=3242729 RepID=UPI003556754D